MMPIVDACVTLSQQDHALSDYLANTGHFHILRMVAVQQAPLHHSIHLIDANDGLEEIKGLQSQATTRGSGGLPNGIVAYCDISDSASIQKLIACADLPNLRGVHHELDSPLYSNTTLEEANNTVASWSQSIALLKANKLSLDITAAVETATVLEAFANAHSDLVVVINVVASPNENQLGFEQWHALFKKVAQYQHVYIKLNGSNMSLHSDGLTEFLHGAVNVIGAERIMLASGQDGTQADGAFGVLWDEFVSAADHLTARQRNMIFRTNAVNVYNL